METLKRSRDFDRVFRSGQSVACRELIMFFCRSRYPGSRVGYCVSKKLGKAVVRNKVRRRLRELMRGLEAEVGPHWDLVILAKKSAVMSSFQSLEAGLKRMILALKKKKKRKASSKRSRSG